MLAASRSNLVEEAAWENEINMGTGEEISAEGRERERERSNRVYFSISFL